jgi:hypothetical protein
MGLVDDQEERHEDIDKMSDMVKEYFVRYLNLGVKV